MEKINMILGMLEHMLELAEENKKIREEYSKLLEKNRENDLFKYYKTRKINPIRDDKPSN